MSFVTQFWNLLVNAGVERGEYIKVKPAIIEANRRSLTHYCGVALLFCALMTILSYYFSTFVGSRGAYFVCGTISLVLLLVSMGPAKHSWVITYLSICCFDIALLGFGIALGTIVDPHNASISFAVLLFAVPLLFTDVPIRTILLTIVGIVAYCIAAYHTQDSAMYTFNLAAVIPYGAISMAVSIFLMRLKVNSFVLQDKTAILEEIKALNHQLEENQAQLEEASAEQESQLEEITSLNNEMQESQQKIEEARDAAEAANAAKTSFLFNMSHDIRTPMNAIIGFTNVLRKYQDVPERREDCLNKIDSSSKVLLSIINNVLEMARIEKGTIEIDEAAWSADQFYDTLYSVFCEMMEQKGISFTREINVQHNYVYCDPTKLREVFINIISNAYKYTNPGGSVHMELTELPSDRPGYAVYQTTISDSGIGMSKDFLPHIFDEFSRENNTTSNKIEGTGLGMPIVKRLVDLMGGSIVASSQKGIGSTFTITISHKIADRSSLVEYSGVIIDPNLFKGKRILLAEDNELNAEIAIEILQDTGFIVEHAVDGAVCLEMLEQAEDNYYSVILMDIQMPNMNGYEATRAIRALSDTAKASIPILALTANAFEEDKRDALNAGMNGHLSKPIEIKELMKALAVILS